MRSILQRLLAAATVAAGLVVLPALPATASPASPSHSGYDASGKDRPSAGATHSSTQKRSLGAQTMQAPECPPILMSKCSFDPAAYALNDPADITSYGNYDLANRPADHTQIKGVTIHDIEGTCEAAVAAFKDPSYFVSSTYVICADGRVIQMVPLKDISWTAGNWWYNQHFVQIEHAGYASNPNSYTLAMYTSSILLVKWLSQKYGFPLDRGHVHGHDNVQAQRTGGIAGMHVDPGPFWNWQNYMAALGAPVVPANVNPMLATMVTVAPVWPLSKQVVTGCNVSNEVPPPCVPAGSHNTNFMYLRTQPSTTAPLITDPVTGPGSTEIENRSARAFYGQKFVVIDRKFDAQGIWYKVWFGGQGAWFQSPYTAPTAFPATGTCAKPKGSTAVTTYGRPLPELSEWPTGFTPPPGSQPAPSALAYTIPAGQCYAVIEQNVTADHYFSWSLDDTYPRFTVVGKTKYVWLYYNGRHVFAKQADVTLV